MGDCQDEGISATATGSDRALLTADDAGGGIDERQTLGSGTPAPRVRRRGSGRGRSRGRSNKGQGGRRNATATRNRILRAGRAEFSQHGYGGARIERVARRSRSNIRMIYHYFGGKEKLYLAVLEDTYRQVREQELQLDLEHLEPAQGMRQLVELTFDYLLDNPDFVKLICNENLLRGKFLKKSRVVPETTLPLVKVMENLLRRGQASGVFHRNIGPVQLYVTLLALCFTHISNRYTLSTMFQKNLADARWLSERRAHAVDVVLTYLTSGT